MDYSSAKQILNKIESEIDVTKIEFHGKSIWPVLKSYFFFGLLKFSVDGVNSMLTQNIKVEYRPGFIKKMSNHFLNFASLIPNSFFSFVEISKIKIQLKNKSVLFMDAVDELYVDEITGKKYSRYVTPYYEFINGKKDTLFLNMSKIRSKHKKLYEPYYFNSSHFIANKEIKAQYSQKIQSKPEDIFNYDVFQNIISSKPYNSVTNKNRIIDIMNEITIYEQLWLKILKGASLKLVFFECFYGNHKHYGLISACKQLNIKVVDIQHGIAADEMYQGWDKAPSKGFCYLPDYYWCWSNYDVNLVSKSRRNSSELMPVLGGNLWLGKNLTNTIINKHDQVIQSMISSGNYEKVMLITLQYNIPISEILVKAIKDSPKNWLWLVRFHPLDYNDPGYRDKYISEFEQYQNVEFSNTTKANLYFLIKISSIHLTHHSSSSIEAISFNVSTILLGRKFENTFRDYIDSGIFYIAESAHDIIDYITNEKYKKIRNEFDFFKIEYSNDVAGNLLNKLMN